MDEVRSRQKRIVTRKQRRGHFVWWNDVVIKKSKGVNRIVGLVNTGVEGEDMRMLLNQSDEKTLATHVLQFIFLGFNGFRFPIAHFPTKQVSAIVNYILCFGVSKNAGSVWVYIVFFKPRWSTGEWRLYQYVFFLQNILQ